MRGPAGLRSVLFWAILSAQLLVPILQLRESRPARFGWQMFSGVGPPIEFAVTRLDGTVDIVDVEDYLAWPRPEMDLASSFPPALCRRIEDAEAVRVEIVGRGEAVTTTEFDCR